MKLKRESCYLVPEGILKRIVKYKIFFKKILKNYEKAYQAFIIGTKTGFKKILFFQFSLDK